MIIVSEDRESVIFLVLPVHFAALACASGVSVKGQGGDCR